MCVAADDVAATHGLAGDEATPEKCDFRGKFIYEIFPPPHSADTPGCPGTPAGATNSAKHASLTTQSTAARHFALRRGSRTPRSPRAHTRHSRLSGHGHWSS